MDFMLVVQRRSPFSLILPVTPKRKEIKPDPSSLSFGNVLKIFVDFVFYVQKIFRFYLIVYLILIVGMVLLIKTWKSCVSKEGHSRSERAESVSHPSRTVTEPAPLAVGRFKTYSRPAFDGASGRVIVPVRDEINGHKYVDLGLSVKWATCNLGASSPIDNGNYYAWGEVVAKSEYLEANSVTYDKVMGDIGGDSRYDAARFNWGGSWRLPTKSECEELHTQCIWTKVEVKHKKGYYKITGKNGNYILLPVTGRYRGTSLGYENTFGYFWSSTPYESGADRAYGLHFFLGGHYVFEDYRCLGRCVRPVTE